MTDVPAYIEKPAAPSVPPLSVSLADVINDLKQPRDGSLGAVPVPETWRCFRAILGGASDSVLRNPTGTRFDECARDGQLFAGLHIFTGQTGGGKTALVVNLARTAAAHGHPVLYVSLEIDAQELGARVVGLEGDLEWYKLAQYKHLSDADIAKRDAGIAALKDTARLIHILAPDPGEFQLSSIKREALRLWRETGKTPLVIFDYLQLAPALLKEKDLQLRELITDVTFTLRHLSRVDAKARLDEHDPDATAHWMGCPVVVLSTTARSNVKGDGKVTAMSGDAPDTIRLMNLEELKALPKEAGEIEATAVTAWVIALKAEDVNGIRHLAIRLAKNRMGMPGAWVPFAFNGATGELTEDPSRYRDAQ